MKAKDINTLINWITGAAAVYFIGSAIAGAVKKRKGIGKVERIKRRIYKEVSMAQHAGVDFSKKYDQLTAEEKAALEHVGHEVGWKQSKRSIESGKPYVESYFGSLRRAWNAVSGIQGIGRAYDVKDANGNVCLTWIEDAQAHVDAEQRTLEAERRAAEARKRLQKTRRQSQQLSMFGCGNSDVPNYTLGLLNRYLSSHEIFDVQVVLNYKNKFGHYYVLCGDDQGGRDFYLSQKNIPYFRAYCERNNIEYEEFYLPDEVVSGMGYAQDVEHELWEIWREQLEYGETELDYDAWRRIYGDAYVESI